MANIFGTNWVRWDTVNASASFDGTHAPRRPKVTSIRFEMGAAPGTTTLTVEGQTYFSAVPGAANTVYELTFNPAQYLESLTLTAIGANTVVVVTFE